MTLWNEGDDGAWNTNALEAFLNRKADRQQQSEHSRAHGRHGYDSPHAGLEDSEPDGDAEGQGLDRDRDGDINMSSVPDFPESENYYHNAETAEDQFLNREERTRFFNVILPKMQALALRLPELVKEPIPFLKEQEDSAVTLSQEQIACLLANAFFCTFPCRNTPKLYQGNTHHSRKRPFSGTTLSEKEKKGTRGSSKDRRNFEGGMLNEAPADPYGTASAKGRSIPSADPVGKPLQTSLLNYFSRKEPAKSDNKIEPPNARDTSAVSAPRADDDSKHNSRAGSREGHATGGGGNEKPSRKESFPRYPSINFSSLFYSTDKSAPCTSTNAAKLRCILHYFDRVTSQMPQGAVTYHRQVLNTPITLLKDERLREDAFSYVQVRVERDSPLEDDSPLGALQLDFANKVIGGGVLDRGSVQEEIRFVICPELIISRLFTQRLHGNEAVLIKGAERYSNYNGYARTFEWHSDHVDTTPRDQLGRRKTEICAIDAMPFKSQDQRLEQFSEECVLRELNKAVAGFRRSPITASEWGLCAAEGPVSTTPLIATGSNDQTSIPYAVIGRQLVLHQGNWGCGAFGGHLQLKFLIQLLAASVCGGYSTDDVEDGLSLGRGVIYYTYGLDDLAKEIETFVSHLQGSSRTFEPSLMLECMLQYPKRSSQGHIIGLPNKSLLEYISTAFGFPSNSTQTSSLDASFAQSSISSFDSSLSDPGF
ncbi:hypothetical protein BGZ70_007274 [Mortierella alpina]|uniref:poly(ADP-ribose) glycohydrolase n=1 Tax=Mortierella alpina TaxID=64518 RepID=A0A9P6JEA4_MORAP|nr:hypothetical protein BGZ70_007274 [Mortierella alpina]